MLFVIVSGHVGVHVGRLLACVQVGGWNADVYVCASTNVRACMHVCVYVYDPCMYCGEKVIRCATRKRDNVHMSTCMGIDWWMLTGLG